MNRILFYDWECNKWACHKNKMPNASKTANKAITSIIPNATQSTNTSKELVLMHLPQHDFRAKHMLEILKVVKGTSLQAGIINKSAGSIEVLNVGTDVIELCYTAIELAHCAHTEFFTSTNTSTSPSLSALSLTGSKLALHMLVAHLRPPVMKRVIRDLSTMAVASIHVSISELCEKSYLSSSMWKNSDSILLQGTMQGGGYTTPKLVRSYSLPSALSQLDTLLQAESRVVPDAKQKKTLAISSRNNSTVRIVCDASGNVGLLAYLMKIRQSEEFQKSNNTLTIAIGPERGFTEKEIALFVDRGFIVCHLGNAIFRSESATTLCAGICSLLE